jgi:hypothetical protein
MIMSTLAAIFIIVDLLSILASWTYLYQQAHQDRTDPLHGKGPTLHRTRDVLIIAILFL